jgi:putative N6-adenine-specific DNA methylase
MKNINKELHSMNQESRITDHESNLTPRGLERRIKRYLTSQPCTFFAITVPGFEQILMKEVQALPDVCDAVCTSGGVEFKGPLDTVYFANMQLRTANRVLMRIDSFTARSYPELYNKAKRINWEIYSGFQTDIAFSVSSSSSRLHHTENIENAVFDSMKEVMHSLGVAIKKEKHAAIKYHIRFLDDQCTISIDSSGELLYRRGYRTEVAHAPIRETTASALLLACECYKYPIIADPMCGSGTFLLEAQMITDSISPGLSRSFAFETWPSFMESKYIRLRKNLQEGYIQSERTLIGSDISETAVNAAIVNGQQSGFAERIAFIQKDFFKFNTDSVFGANGLIISNLPYGKRVGESIALHALYKNIGKHLKKYCKGWHYGFVTADKAFPSISGLPVSKEICFVNGGIPVTFFSGEIC